MKLEIVMALVLAGAAIVMRHRADPEPLPPIVDLDAGVDASTPNPAPGEGVGRDQDQAQPTTEELKDVMRVMSDDLARLQARLAQRGVEVEVK